MTDLPPYPDTRDDTVVAHDHAAPPSTPRWVKVFGIIALVLVLLFVMVQLTGGGHGPGRHLPPSSFIEQRVQQA